MSSATRWRGTSRNSGRQSRGLVTGVSQVRSGHCVNAFSHDVAGSCSRAIRTPAPVLTTRSAASSSDRARDRSAIGEPKGVAATTSASLVEVEAVQRDALPLQIVQEPIDGRCPRAHLASDVLQHDDGACAARRLEHEFWPQAGPQGTAHALGDVEMVAGSRLLIPPREDGRHFVDDVAGHVPCRVPHGEAVELRPGQHRQHALPCISTELPARGVRADRRPEQREQRERGGADDPGIAPVDHVRRCGYRRWLGQRRLPRLEARRSQRLPDGDVGSRGQRR